MTLYSPRLIFDLDDTLYDEITYVFSGFEAVATWLDREYDILFNESFDFMKMLLSRDGRGQIFDNLLARYSLKTRANIRKCVSIYRLHKPSISLFPEAKVLLSHLKNYNKYIVTDGNKMAQARKIEALKITNHFKKIYITHRYGIHNAKPSLYCFERIRQSEKCRYEDMVYVGDNPKKDFVNLKKVGIRTVRVLTGNYRDLKMSMEYEAEITIRSIGEFDLRLF